MVYAWEFEFFDSDGIVDAVPCGSLGGGGTFGSDLNDAIESAADFLACMVDDHLMGGIELPAPDFGHQPQHGGKIIAVAVSRELGDIPAVTAADAARMLGVSSARVSQLINAGMLDSWKGRHQAHGVKSFHRGTTRRRTKGRAPERNACCRVKDV